MTTPTRYQVSVTFTDECNMRCVYCTTAKRKVFITEAILDRVVMLLERAAPASLDLNFHGGEPTLVWPMVEYLNAALAPIAASRRVSRNLCTNGTHLDATRAAFLKRNGFDVRVSIDGSKASHTRFRFGRDRRDPTHSAALYDRTLLGLQALIAAEVSTAANMVVTAQTVGSLLRNAVFLIRQGLIHLVISPVVGMPWPDEALLMFDAQLRGMTPIWQRWMQRVSPRRHEDLRRSILSEIDRAAYCIGERMNQPDARILVIGPDGRIFGDEPDVRTDKALVIGHVDDIEDLSQLPALPRTAFQLMYDREFYPPHVLRDVRRTHRLLRKRLVEMYAVLFPSQPMVIDRGGGVIPEDRIPQPVGEPLMDYVLTPYPPVVPPAGRLHSASLLRHFLRTHGLLRLAWPVIERLEEHLGSGQTVWGIKQDRAGGVGIELYFYNHCRNAPGSRMSVTRLCAALADRLTIPGDLDESLPYIMCSLELDAARLEDGRCEGFRIYLAGQRSTDGHDGISYLVTQGGLIRENRYSFFDAAGELEAVQGAMARSLHGAASRDVLLHPRLRKCHTICYAEKRLSDALYFSRITTPQLRAFLRAYLPGALAKAVTAHADDLAHLRWDVGYDFQRRPAAATSRIIKAGVYGYV